ncbi:MAG TPA: immunoglobulin domain-containing protein, partial [Candidatus Dormibacteraeota bacterium]|nr:immunoglobulin domain-containing protein [Candidatus Dormibacteraeota bacterium]
AAFDPTTGVFRWTPDTLGDFPVTFRVSDNAGLTNAEIITLSIRPLPKIVVQPQSQIVRLGATVTLEITASDTQTLSYQWQFDGTNISDATASAYQVPRMTSKRAGAYRVVVSNPTDSVTSQEAVLVLGGNSTAKKSVRASIAHLNHEMDLYHNTIDVYTDISAGGNHFHARGQLPDDLSLVTIDGSWTNNPHSGATCNRCAYTPRLPGDFGGFYFLNGILVGRKPLPYFGEATVAGTDVAVTRFTGLNLAGASSLTFWARGENGGERIQFFMGGVGRAAENGQATTPFPDSTPRVPALGRLTKLTRNWRRYSIPLHGLNLTNIMGGFGWVAAAGDNPNGATFYIDDIQYQLSPRRLIERRKEPRFIRSFATKALQPSLKDGNPDDDIDLVLRNTAFLYDNAVAALAYLAEGSKGSLQRAALIGDAMLYAASHDRTYSDGRFRTAYSSGDIALPPGWSPNGKPGTVPVPGYYDEDSTTFFEVENADIDTGNNAWAMVALLGIYKATGNAEYLNAAKAIGKFILPLRATSGLYQGFLGGIQDAETGSATNRTYASTEHNLDLYAAFTRLFQMTGDSSWQDAAEHAREFVESMWSESKGCYFAGTLGDPNIRNEIAGQIPLDTHSWTVLSITNILSVHPRLLAFPEQNHLTTSDAFTGFDFNDDKDGVWFEGTAQMSVAYAFAGEPAKAEMLRQTLRTAQRMPAPVGDMAGMVAASHDGVTSGFGFKLFRRLHLGATSWNIFGQLGFDPYYQTKAD